MKAPNVSRAKWSREAEKWSSASALGHGGGAELPHARVPRAHPAARAARQGLTLVHISAQRKHILWDTLGA